MLTAARIIDDANQIARPRGYTVQGLDMLNVVLSDLCHTTDLALARGQFSFNFNPGLVTGSPFILDESLLSGPDLLTPLSGPSTAAFFGSGPYTLPLDYLRTSGSSGARGVTRSAWYLYPAPAFPAGQPIFMTPIDLAEFDLFPKLPSQSTPELWCTDMGAPLTHRIILSTAMATTINSTTATPAAMSFGGNSLAVGLGVSGEGIQPGTTITSVGATTIVMSLPATQTYPTASVVFGICPVAYVYPAPQGNWPVTVRYQRMMPPLLNTMQYPWFPNDGYLIDKLAAKMMAFSNHPGEGGRDAKAERELGRYLGLADDKTNRAQQVQLDGRMFGRGGAAGQNLRNTKTQGW